MSLAYEEQTWAVHAACSDVDPDSLFVRGAAQRQVRNVCFSCPVRLECLADALNANATFGVWGGLTERERRAILRRYPDEDNWFDRLKNSTEQLAVELRAGRVPRIS
ncbi:WhiB family transcriptional regulator [Arcanobacterium buesumense]|uniref:Transcriptional regulator WhiB n=1 Tax=Arcanobacterium buesumense TaxID=2722751 RepID=A0A6H2EN95_9ACTO|nr:WhiB family transcriptional regulator [Arcanobacterium buesumense]QJC22539.1 WhiB family transcriptional regulator [Arcanobacterium buesumense]